MELKGTHLFRGQVKDDSIPLGVITLPVEDNKTRFQPTPGMQFTAEELAEIAKVVKSFDDQDQ